MEHPEEPTNSKWCSGELRPAALVKKLVSKWDAEYRLRNVNEAMTAMELYRPRLYPGRLTLFRARGGSPAINADRFGGWGETALGGVDVHDFQCDHMELFNDPHCQDVATAFQYCLDRAGQQLGSGATSPVPTSAPLRLLKLTDARSFFVDFKPRCPVHRL